MSFILKPLRVIRNHWKKSILFAGVTAYGLNWANETRKEELIRTDYCVKAKSYGDKTISTAFSRPDSVLVLINRSAANSRAKTVFDKNCLPILHLAGLDIETHDWDGTYDAESTAALDKFLKNPEKTYSAVLVVGGNRTVNAFLNYSVSQKQPTPPAAFIPAGHDSIVMTRFLPFLGSTAYVRRMCEVAYKVVQGRPETVDVLKIETKPRHDDDNNANSLYGVSSFAFDKVTDLSHKSFRYWYLPGITKRIFVGLVGLAMGHFDDRIIGDIDATSVETPVVEEKAPEKPASGGGWFSRKPAPKPQPVVESIPQELIKKPVCTGEFDADFVSISPNHPNKVGRFLVEVSFRNHSQWSAFGMAVMKQQADVEKSFEATDLTLNLKLIPRVASFYVDGVPHSDFERVVKISILPKSFKMFY